MFFGAGHWPRGQKIPPVYTASYHRPLSLILGSLYWPQQPVLFDYKLANTSPKMWITVKFFSPWKKVKSSLSWEFNSGWDLCISLREKSGPLVQEVISYSLHPNASICSGTEKEMRDKDSPVHRAFQIPQLSCGWSSFSFLLFLQLLATKRRESPPPPTFRSSFGKAEKESLIPHDPSCIINDQRGLMLE